MFLPNEGVELVFKHSSAIIGIFHFDLNNQNHFISLSDDGELIEWIFNQENLKIYEISKIHLKRPSNDLLSQNKHNIRQLKKGEYYKISQVIQFDNFIALGYSDGVILVYEVTKKQKMDNVNNKNKISKKIDLKNKEEKIEEKKENEEENEEKENNSNSILEEDKIESESNVNLNEVENEKHNEDNNTQDNKTDLDYYNFFNLYYVLLGNVKEINSLCYIPQTKILVSSSDDYTVKIYDFNTGHLKYYFKLDFIINRILYQNISRNKNDPKIILTLLSNDPVKVIINLYSNPITFNNYYFNHNNIIQLEKINDKYYGLNLNNIIILDKNLIHECTFISLNNGFFKYFNIFKNDYLLVDNENYIRRIELINKEKEKENDAKDKNKKNEKSKKPNKNDEDKEDEEKIPENTIITDFKIKVGEDHVKGLFYVDNYIFAYCQDGKLFLVNYDKIIQNYERIQMAIEDDASLQMMASMVYVKKAKKKKGKKGKEKKKK